MQLLRRALEGLFNAGTPEVFTLLEREAIESAYRFCHRNQVRTAGLLGITRNVLRAQLKRFGLIPGGTRDAEAELSAPARPTCGLHMTRCGFIRCPGA